MAAAAEQWEDPTGGENREPATQEKATDKPSECRAETEVPSPAGESQHTTAESRRPKRSEPATERIWGQFWKGSGFGKANAKKKREGTQPNRSGQESNEGESPTASTAKQVECRQRAPPESTTAELGSPTDQLSLEVEAGSGVQPMEKLAGTEEVEKDDDSKETRRRHIEKSSSVRDFIRRPISKIFSYKTTEKKAVDRQANVGKGLSTSLDRLSEKGTSTAIYELENDPGRRHKAAGLAHTRRWHSFKKIVAPKTHKKSLQEPTDNDEGDDDHNETPKLKDLASGGDPENKARKKRSIKRSWTFQVIRKDHSFTTGNKAPSWSEDPMTVKHDWIEQIENQTDQDNQLVGNEEEEDAVEGGGMHRDTERKASPSNGNSKSRDHQASEVWKSFKKLVTPKSMRTTEATETEESHITEGQVSLDKSSRQQAVPKKARNSRAMSLKNIILRKSKSKSTDLEEAATGTAPISNLPGAALEREETQSCKEETATASSGEIKVDSSGDLGDLSEPKEGLSDIQKHSVSEQVRDAGKEQKETATVQSDVAEKVQDITGGNADLCGKPESDQSLGCNLPTTGTVTSHQTNKEIKDNFNSGVIKETPLSELKETAEKEPAENIKEGALDPSPGRKSLNLKDKGNETAGLADALVEPGLSESPVKDTGKELPPCERTEVLRAGHRSGESTQDEPSSHQQPALKHSAETEQTKESLPQGVIVNARESMTPDAARSIPEIRVKAPTDPLEASQKAGDGSSDEMTSNLEDDGRSSTAQTDSIGAPAEINAEEILRTETVRAEGIGSSTDIFHKACSSKATVETKAEKTLDKDTSHDTDQDSPPSSIENLRKPTSSEAEMTATDAVGCHDTEGGPNIENSSAETGRGDGSPPPSSTENLHINPEEEEKKLFYEAAAAIVRTAVNAATEQIAKEQDTLDNGFKGSYSNNDDNNNSGMDLSYCR
ncbi:A-kinase anchor protein 12-like [Acipenser oxyrinchus oxyrinchus]|uniref:A-kinase anchor protein 12-like n=1 Tax=Acipenser oxyrinchus oxyrinchus TaxID=40147 RepID=A0AAD8CGH2_ACIOX|nr:A-kinase anchor protein 12-like [Acipenser oxyrinchus oxyrinchus]